MGNGYVLIPINHPLYGKDYCDIDINVHGKLTFSEFVSDKMIDKWQLDKKDKYKWCVGFDTIHNNDNLLTWPKEKVLEETERLKTQLMAYKSVSWITLLNRVRIIYVAAIIYKIKKRIISFKNKKLNIYEKN